jgi:hypothetical protein
MFALQLVSVVFLAVAAFTFVSYILINNFLIEWNDEF